MSSAVTTTARIVLKVPADWIPWLEMVKSTIITGQIWEFVNPLTATGNLPPLAEPTWPKPGSLTRI